MGAEQTDPQLAEYRASIDNIDAALVHLLAERFKITKAVGRYKKDAQLPPADPGREEIQIARLRTLAEDAGLDDQDAGNLGLADGHAVNGSFVHGGTL